MARDIRDEIEGLFKAAAEDPSLGDAPKKRVSTKAGPPASAPSGQTNAGQKKSAPTHPPPASAGAPAGKPKAQTTLPPQSSPFASKDRKTPTTDPPPAPPSPARKTNATLPPGPSPLSNGNTTGTLPGGKKSASTITPEFLRKSGPVTGASVPAMPASSRDTPRPPPSSQRSLPSVKAVTSAPSAPSTPVRAKKKGGRKEVIDYAPDEPLVDHRGRSKPMYKPRSPRPRSWRPSKPIRLLLGLFPGTRLMALESISQGWPYTALGMLALVPAIFLMLGFTASAARVDMLSIDERWLLAHATAIFVLIGVFEMLRLGAFFEEKTSGPRVPRILAALTVPAFLVIVGAPRLIPLWPQLVEAAWCAAVVLALGGLAGSAWCLLDGTVESSGAQRSFRIVGIVLIVLLLVGGVLTGVLVPGTLVKLAAWARAIGFQALPGLLGG